MKYNRVLLKISGEALKDKTGNMIIDSEFLSKVASSIKIMVDKGVEVAVVIGAGNIFRGKLAADIGIEHSVADYMGMLGTIINCLALQSALENQNVNCRVMSAIQVNEVCEPYIRRKAIHHLQKKIVTIFAGGTGNPYFTTDTTASLRAIEINADAILMAKNGVEGVYSADPKVDKKAVLYKHLTYQEIFEKNLSVMDQTAVAMLKEKNINTIVFSMQNLDNFSKIIDGEDIGTTISN